MEMVESTVQCQINISDPDLLSLFRGCCFAAIEAALRCCRFKQREGRVCHLKAKRFKLYKETGGSMDHININKATAEPPNSLITRNYTKPAFSPFESIFEGKLNTEL